MTTIFDHHDCDNVMRVHPDIASHANVLVTINDDECTLTNDDVRRLIDALQNYLMHVNT